MDKQSYSEFRQQIKAMDEKIRKEGKALFWGLAKEVFESNPELKSFTWSQYTPYFNDGNECVFRVNSDYIRLNGSDDEYDSYDLREESEYGPSAEDLKEIGFSSRGSASLAQEAVSSLLSEIEDNHMQMIFGDHCQVIVSKNGDIETSECSHD